MDAALNNFAHKDQVEVIYRSFELDPSSKRDVDGDYFGKLVNKYGMTRNQAIESAKNLERQAKMVGLEFNFENIVMTNTFDAHRLTQFAAEKGKMHEMTERLFRAYFTESKHIGDPQTLALLAEEVGLNGSEVATLLKGEGFSKEVRGEEQEAANLGVTGVPFYVIDRKYAVSGAQPSEVFLQAIERAWQETQPLTVLNDQGEVCDELGCRIPDKKE